jgi:hypothetical protein
MGQESNINSLLTISKIKWLFFYFYFFLSEGGGLWGKVMDLGFERIEFHYALFFCLQSYLILQEINTIC